MGADAVSQELAYARRAWQELEELTTRPRQRQRAVQSWRFRYYAFKRKLEHEAERGTAQDQEAQYYTAEVQVMFDGVLDSRIGKTLVLPPLQDASNALREAFNALKRGAGEHLIELDSALEMQQAVIQVDQVLRDRYEKVSEYRKKRSEGKQAYEVALKKFEAAEDKRAEYDRELAEFVADDLQNKAVELWTDLRSKGYDKLGLGVYDDNTIHLDDNELRSFIVRALQEPVWWRDVQEALDEMGVPLEDYTDDIDELYKALASSLGLKMDNLRSIMRKTKQVALDDASGFVGSRPSTPEKPDSSDYLPPRPSESEFPAWPTLKPAKSGLSDDMLSLLEQMDAYAYGAYTATYEHVAQINELAATIGHSCPTLELVGDDLDLSALHSYLGEVESAWGGFAQGGAGNSQEGQTVINQFKDAVAVAKQARTLDELTAAKTELSTAIDRLYIWVTDRWYQFGGRPTQHKGSAKEKKIIKIQTAFGVISNKK